MLSPVYFWGHDVWLGLWMSIKLTRTTLFNLNNSILPGIIIILTLVETKILRSLIAFRVSFRSKNG